VVFRNCGSSRHTSGSRKPFPHRVSSPKCKGNTETALWSRGKIEFAGKTVSARPPCTPSRSSKATTNNGHRSVEITEHRAKRNLTSHTRWIGSPVSCSLDAVCQLHELFTALGQRNDHEQWMLRAMEEAATDDF
jgi:hypothetical protein